MICPQCGSEYEVTSAKTLWRVSDPLECEVCDYVLKTGSGSRVYATKLIKRGEWPKKEPIQS
jgi:hypothetical protein